MKLILHNEIIVATDALSCPAYFAGIAVTAFAITQSTKKIDPFQLLKPFFPLFSPTGFLFFIYVKPSQCLSCFHYMHYITFINAASQKSLFEKNCHFFQKKKVFKLGIPTFFPSFFSSYGEKYANSEIKSFTANTNRNIYVNRMANQIELSDVKDRQMSSKPNGGFFNLHPSRFELF